MSGNDLRNIVLLAGFALLVPGQIFAEEPPAPGDAAASTSLLEGCWMPYALTWTEEELKPGRSRVRFDLESLKQEPLAEPVPVPQDLRGSIRSVELPPGKKLVALTFDLCEGDGISAGYDGRIVDLLRAQGIKATFFVGGKWLETHPERAQQLIADPNFEIGGHGLRHRDLTHVSATVLEEEIRLTEAAYVRARKAFAARTCVAGALEASGTPQERLTLMRFPYGRCNATSLAAVVAAGQLAIQWDVVTGDPDPHVSAKTIANTLLTRVHPGAIVVAHANGRGRNTAAALELALPKLKEEGYRFVTVSELIAAGKPVIADKCYLNQPGPRPGSFARSGATQPMTPGPFSAVADLEHVSLRPLAAGAGAGLEHAIVAMPPWSVMDYPAQAMARYLASADDGARRYLIEVGGETAGAMSVRYPWLKGPYLELLALLPAFQGQGIGAGLLHWFEQEALKRDARNLWVCASHFNERALRFYARHGFTPAATLPGLVADGYDEILLRKGPLGNAAGG